MANDDTDRDKIARNDCVRLLVSRSSLRLMGLLSMGLFLNEVMSIWTDVIERGADIADETQLSRGYNSLR